LGCTHLNGNDEPGFINNEENSYHVVRGEYLDDTTVIDGFTINGGHADAVFPDQSGAGFLDPGSATISNCILRANWADGFGGAVYTNRHRNFENCIFAHNYAGGQGGGVYETSGGPAMTNCTFYANGAGLSAGAVRTTGGTVTSCIAWGNLPDQINGGHVYYSDIEGGWSGTGSDNIDSDPEFFDPDGPDDVPGTEDDDFRLYASSPCIEMGDTSVVIEPTDLAGNPRLLDADGDETADVDMGAYEFTCRRVDAPEPDPLVVDLGFGTRNRYLSFHPLDPDPQTGMRISVRSTTMTQNPDFTCTLDPGERWWLTEPVAVTESAGSDIPDPPPSLWTSVPTCSPYYGDWTPYDIVHAYGPAVFAGTVYDVQTIHELCDPGAGGTFDESHFSRPLTISTSAHGDVVGDCGVRPCSPPQGVADMDDVTAIVEKFQNEPIASQKARTDIAPDDFAGRIPNRKVDFVDIGAAVDAFMGFPYPFANPCDPENREDDLCSF
jgi:hypothetical protein